MVGYFALAQADCFPVPRASYSKSCIRHPWQTYELLASAKTWQLQYDVMSEKEAKVSDLTHLQKPKIQLNCRGERKDSYPYGKVYALFPNVREGCLLVDTRISEVHRAVIGRLAPEGHGGEVRGGGRQKEGDVLVAAHHAEQVVLGIVVQAGSRALAALWQLFVASFSNLGR